MRLACYQFAAGADIDKNHAAVKRGIEAAGRVGARLLVFQECAACGYPPVERPDVAGLDFEALERQWAAVRHMAKAQGVTVALGTARREGGAVYNSLRIAGDDGANLGHYDKRALWGWDREHFSPGTDVGVFEVEGVRVGLRICYEVRFPEYFRELLAAGAELCCVSFCDVAAEAQPARYDTIKAHLLTRAVENVMTVVSVNSVSACQNAPTAVFGVDGALLAEAPKDVEHLLVYDYERPALGFSARGRLENARALLGL